MQMVLPLGQLLELPLPKPTHIRQHLYKTRKNRTASLPNLARPIQQTLPLTETEAKLQSIRIQKGYQPESSESLIAEKVSHWSLEQRREIMLPETLIDLLKAANATFDEWNNCIDLYQVVGLPGCLNYIQGLEYLRTHFHTQPVFQSVSAFTNNTVDAVQRQTQRT